MKSNFLEMIKAKTIEKLKRSKINHDHLRKQVTDVRVPHDFLDIFLQKPKSLPVCIVSEIKFASPSQGKISTLTDPVQIARKYLTSGACALSILTESEYFNGSLSFLEDG